MKIMLCLKYVIRVDSTAYIQQQWLGTGRVVCRRRSGKHSPVCPHLVGRAGVLDEAMKRCKEPFRRLASTPPSGSTHAFVQNA